MAVICETLSKNKTAKKLLQLVRQRGTISYPSTGKTEHPETNSSRYGLSIRKRMYSLIEEMCRVSQ